MIRKSVFSGDFRPEFRQRPDTQQELGVNARG